MIDVTPPAGPPPEAVRPRPRAPAPPNAVDWSPSDARARARLSAIRAYEDAEELDVHDRDLLRFRFHV